MCGFFQKLKAEFLQNTQSKDGNQTSYQSLHHFMTIPSLPTKPYPLRPRAFSGGGLLNQRRLLYSKFSLFLYSIMACDWKAEQSVLFFSSTADIMNHQGHPCCRLLIAHNHDMRPVSTDCGCDDISRKIVFGFLGHSHGVSLSLKKGDKIGDPAMVDIGVRSLQSPYCRILRKSAFHVLMHELLEVDIACFTQCTNYNVCTDPPLDRHVTTGIFKANVCRVIDHRSANLTSGGSSDRRRFNIRRCLRVSDRFSYENMVYCFGFRLFARPIASRKEGPNYQQTPCNTE